MADEEFGPISAIVRSLLNPYRNIMQGKLDTISPVEKHLEATYIPERDRPTEQQLQAIGRVATAFSVLERMFGLVLARLALAPDFPTMALTKDLSPDNHLKALKMLLALHAERYRRQIVSQDLATMLTNMGTEFARLKDECNIVVHTCWFKFGDTISGLEPRPSTMAKSSAFPPPKKTVPELNDLADLIQRLADAMFITAQLLPEVDEVQHAQSLSQVERHRLPEIRKEPEGPPESS
jgi:hypothetical protein